MKTYRDIQGDGGSDILGQVASFRRSITDSLAGVDHVVAVASGKGGVGKSTVTMLLAQGLRHRGREVAILDADINGPCQARLAGLSERPWAPGERGLVLPRRADGIGVVSVGSVVEEGEPVTFESVASGDEQTWRATREFTLFGQLLAGVEWGELGFLLVDLPPGAERTMQFAGFLGPGVGFVLVTIPSQTARGVVERSLSGLRDTGSRVLGVIENMSGYRCSGCGEVRPLFPDSGLTEDGEGGGLETVLLGRIPFDPEIARACDAGWPVHTTDLPAAALESSDAVMESVEEEAA